MAGVMLIMLYVLSEMSYESFHARKDRIYRVAVDFGDAGSKMGFAGVMPALGPVAAAQIPEVVNTVRWRRDYQAKLEYAGRSFVEQNFFFVDSTVFDVFSFKLLDDTRSHLKEPFTAVISQSLAAKYFGQSDPIGRTLLYNDVYNLRITGVMADVPVNTHLKGDILVAYATLIPMGRADEGEWNSCGKDFTYLLLREKARPEVLLKKLNELLVANAEANTVRMMTLKLQPLTDIHFNTECFVDWGRKGSLTYVYVFSSVAFLILLLAAFNFINLSTAQFQHRRSEVGVKKVLGAGRFFIFTQFLIESLFVSFCAVMAALALFETAYPFLNSFLGYKVLINPWSQWQIIMVAILLGAIVGFLAGFYPALSFSGFKLISASLKSLSGVPLKTTSRRLLVIAQFAVTVILMVATVVIFKQLAFMRNSNLGFDKDNVIILNISTSHPEEQADYAALKEILRQHPAIIGLSGAYTLPGLHSKETWSVRNEEASPEDYVTVRTTAVDAGYLETLGLQLVQGRNFSEDNPAGIRQGILVNEAAVRKFGLDNPVEKKLLGIRANGQEKTDIIGVVRDFHVASFREEIEPLIMYVSPDKYYALAIRIHPEKTNEAMAYIEQSWSMVFPGKTFEYTFLEDIYNNLYVSEKKMGQLLSLFSMLAVFIACLGLFGLVTFMVEKRKKEISIRKVLGASVINIVFTLVKDFTRWIIIANLISWPIAYLVVSRWLQNYAYRIAPGWSVFVLVLVAVILLAVLTISIQSVKTALSNPVVALKNE